ncbi:dATP/dGTP pyrophosphohydrolase domain-containing protein [Klebsiella pneumoniae]|uniref:dATP/dGTP pyrophosphohydrolase domain-containing protein n=1 Tax=Klebsiella pneumoniae TaxID=573 RepID=UPI001BD04C1F|nr:dATP/dGTP pyrophosphohydrolase domain-containing protein [Klebsiella pneumoniae]MBS4563509.1 DUF550 domain-containing protein [Klebsiella pneumoniae]
MSEFSRETLLNIIETDHVQCGEASALAHMALAAMDSEPVVKKVACWSCQNEVEIAAISDCDGCCPKCGTRIHLDEEPYIAPLSAPDRDQVRQEHAEWSQATFGNVGPVGPLKHLSKEALEAAAEPGDLSEWADMQFLLWDAQRRAGITDEQITQAMIEKLAVNKQRSWPEPKDGEPRLHIKAQPAPVVPDKMTAIVKDEAEYVEGWNACRAAMLQELKKSAGTEAICRSDENVQVLHTKSPAQSDCCPAQNHVSPEQNGDTPAQSQGWIPVSERMPEDDDFVYIWPRPDFGVELHVGQYCECSPKGDGWYAQVYEQNYGIEWHPITVTHWMPLPNPPKEEK